MLLQQIVATLDGELERLSSLREIVSSLAGPSVIELRDQISAVEEEEDLSPVVNEAPSRQASAKRVKRATSGEPKSPVKRVRPGTEPTALTGVIPVAPVVVTAEALAREGARSQKRSAERRPEPSPAPGTLGSMIRALRLEANS